MWRTVLQRRSVQDLIWQDAYPQWLGTPTDPFWWGTGDIPQARDLLFEEFLNTISGLEVQETVSIDDNLPDVVDYDWPWVAITIDQLESFPPLPEGFDQISFNLFRYSARRFAMQMDEQGAEMRIVIYCVPSGDYLD